MNKLTRNGTVEVLNKDVVVVGSGAAGLTAAVMARLMGLDVLLLEKTDVIGGTTALSGGGIWTPCSPVAQRAGVNDTLDAARLYMQSVCGEGLRLRLADTFLQAGPEMIDRLERQAGLRFTVALDRPDYYCERPGGTLGGRCLFPVEFDGRQLGRHLSWLRPPLREMTFLGMMMRPASDLRHFLNAGRSIRSFLFVAKRLSLLARDRLLHGRPMQLAGGNALVAHLFAAALRLGVDIRRSTAVQELVLEQGRVSGVLCRTSQGMLRVSARKGVVLATGGFPHDLQLRSRHYPHASGPQQHVSPAPSTNTGDGIRLAIGAGARTPALSDASCWAPVSVVRYRNGTTAPFPHLIDRQKPGFIAVTRQGHRFVNESHSYHEFGRGLIAATRTGEEPSCFLLADHRAVRQYGMGFAKPAPIPLFPYLRMGYLTRADTVAELAGKIGVPAGTLVATVDEFNRHAREGKDPAFSRGGNAYNRYLGNANHAPNPCVAPLEVGPFYALKVHMGELGTFAGVETDEHARVLRSDGSPIPGLYAAGNDMSHVMAGQYLGGGAAIGPCMTFGYIAARHMAA